MNFYTSRISKLLLLATAAPLTFGISQCGELDQEDPAQEVSLVQSLVGAPPQITSVSPNMGSVLGGTYIKISGKNFRPGATISFGGVSADPKSVAVVSSTEISCFLPAKPGAFGLAPVTVRHLDGKQATRADLFYYYADRMAALPANTFANGMQLRKAATADLNGDGKVDVIGLNDSNLVLLLGNGDGTLQNPKPISLSAGVTDFALADYDGDGKRDIAVSIGSSSTMNILFGTSDGTFRLGPGTSLSDAWATLTPGDLNNDGKVDLVTYPSTGYPSYFHVLLGNGDGTFRPELSSAPSYLWGVSAIADFNRDGKNDVIGGLPIGWLRGIGSGHDIGVLPGLGDGTFDAARAKTFSTNELAEPVLDSKIADLNNDGILDLVFVLGTSPYKSPPYRVTAASMLGKGDGSFLSPVTMNLGDSATNERASIGVIDLTNDGKPDLVLGTGAKDSFMIPGNGDGTFQPARQFSALLTDRIEFADFDGDGKLDLLTGGNGINILLNTGTGSFADPLFIPAATAISAMRSGDLNGDKKTDVVVASYDTNSVKVLLGSNLARASGTKILPVGTGPTGIERADLNGDGKLDLVVSNFDSSNISVLIGSGDGNFAPTKNYACGTNPSGIVVADLNGDGKQDVATSNFGSDNISVLLGTTSSLGAAKSYAVQKAPTALAAADLNGDGKLDLVTTNADSGTVSVLLNSSTGFAAAKHYPVGKLPSAVAIADLNGDGKQDLAVSNADSNSVSVLLNNGAGAFASAVANPTCSYPTAILARDLDRDGRMDLAVSCDNAPASVNLLMGFGNGAFFPSQLTLTRTGSGPLAIDDVNGDGRLDFILANEATGQLSLFLNRTP